MVSLPLVHGGSVSIDPEQVAAIRQIEQPGIIDNGKTEVTLRSGVTYEVSRGERTVREILADD